MAELVARPSLCSNCIREPARRNGRCHPCSLYWRRTGRERPVEVIVRSLERRWSLRM